MKRRIDVLAASVCAAMALLGTAAANAATACAELKQLQLPETTITTAEPVAAGEFTAPGLVRPLKVPAMCRVAGVVTPAIKFEVWLPEGNSWNGRFQAVGGGGLAGVISYGALADAVNGGYASASTDTGHEASDTANSWTLDRQRVTDYGYRAIHEMTVKAKAVIDAHYGKAPEYSYFNGCSTGGRQGLMEAQRYPNDYNGIISGAPVNRFTNLHMGQLWTAHATLKKPGAVLTRDDLAKVSAAVLAQCDAADGVKDGMLTDPRTCKFDPGTLQGFRPEQIEALKMIYRGAVNPRTGVQIYPGLEVGGEGPQPGNPGWGLIMNGKEPFGIDIPVLGGMGFDNLQWDWRTFDFDHDVALIDAKLFGTLNAINPDLSDFKKRGGKLIVYHGWSDPGVMPQQTLDYWNSVRAFAGKSTGGDGGAYTDEFARLYMLPGVGHCRGGVGPDQADWIGTLAGWVEKGKAPAAIVAHRNDPQGKTVMTRPLCPHPQAARYKGKGDTNDAANFECAAPK
jgi:feruloyl esterase